MKGFAHHPYESPTAFLRTPGVRPGTITIEYGGMPIDLMYEDRGYDATVIFFHAALNRDTAQIPAFIGGSFSEGIPANRVFVADPSLAMHPELRLAWYAGNARQPDLQFLLPSILHHLIPAGQRVVLFGPSGGGFAALYYGTFFPGSVAVAVNPQTSLFRYHAHEVQPWIDLAWAPGLGLADLPVTVDLTARYRFSVETEAWFVQNRGDTFHVREHQTPFLSAMHESNRVHLIDLDSGDGHIPPPREQLATIVDAAVRGQERPSSETISTITS
ncbi:hypothetical protein ACIGH6_14175 [Brachybacterium paraconglomeratum]|uniref:hypothetical protein n=1 Tax=Brachybacterium paraconglomeratum TaxID=173362 RepID=UPI0037CA907E